MSKSAQCEPWGNSYGKGKGLRVLADGKETASAAHVYDKRLVDAEAFTTWRRWIDRPLDHKRLADRALGEGLNG